MIRQSLLHFRITAKLGKGGMGEVFRATDTRLGREVAIKVLPEDVAPDGRWQFESEETWEADVWLLTFPPS